MHVAYTNCYKPHPVSQSGFTLYCSIEYVILSESVQVHRRRARRVWDEVEGSELVARRSGCGCGGGGLGSRLGVGVRVRVRVRG